MMTLDQLTSELYRAYLYTIYGVRLHESEADFLLPFVGKNGGGSSCVVFITPEGKQGMFHIMPDHTVNITIFVLDEDGDIMHAASSAAAKRYARREWNATRPYPRFKWVILRILNQLGL